MNKVRYLNKSINDNERNNFSLWWKEQIEHYGTLIRYYTNGYTLTSHNFIYGEDPTTAFKQTGEFAMLTNITNDSIMLSKFGIMADCDMTAVVHISAFHEGMCDLGLEPKAGDLIEMHEYGGFGDRPGFRGAPIYEITERDDQHLELTNALMGHYVWFIKCKRWEYSYEPGMHSEPNNIQTNDGGDYGRLSGGENPEKLFQPYPDSADNSAKCIYDYYDNDVNDIEGRTMAGHFIPPQPCPLNPYPESLQYTAEVESLLVSQLTSTGNAVSYTASNINNIMLRTLVLSSGDTRTFVNETCGDVADDLSYTTNFDTFELFEVDGGII